MLINLITTHPLHKKNIYESFNWFKVYDKVSQDVHMSIWNQNAHV